MATIDGTQASNYEIVSGTFSGTGTSDEVICYGAVIDLTFAGTATVAVQWKVDGTNWRTIASYTTGDQITLEIPASIGLPIRLSCTAHTDDVDYAIYARKG